MRIGFFDSGIGGITVLTEALILLPDQDFLFDADIDHVPYGEKSPDEIARYVMENARFLLSEGAEALVVACNTATAVAIKALRAMTDVPVIGMEPAVKPAIEGLGSSAGGRSRVLVAATPVTLREAKLRDLIDRVDHNHCVDLLPLPGLVPLAEREAFDSGEARDYLRQMFAQALSGAHGKEAYDAFVMGCTHFIYFKPLFRELLGGDMRLIDGNAGTVRRLMDVLNLQPAPSRNTDFDPSRISWYESGRSVTDQERLSYYARLLDYCKRINDHV